ncbi:baseplate protein [Pasteurellaceae bacterium Macca]|nr:baseplate protein [Pasteurellaceae bacterium Macca]MCK3656152.1 baseplate protein [Pasteurellaceae bacterium Macca]MCK3656254.1 baseplate protein [Pasteurellaceae bacterium Macca]MCK3656511.1 baseplate protein [Pasteurellaceae bacterium Macca]MCK3657133.1 baseplate protein [Pasteurellaceae bacterium Macca]
MKNYDYLNATPETATDAQIEQAQKQIHTALPAKVVTFNPANQTVTLAVQIKQLLMDNQKVDIPPLVDVPVSYPRGGGFCVTFPLQAGDEGMVIFSERCIDGWWQSGHASEPLDIRFHDLSDGMFIPGICSVPNAVKGFFTNGLSLQTLDGATFIRLEEGKITIQGDIVHTGNTNQQGSTTVSEQVMAKNIIGSVDVTAGGISGKSHTHSGVESGNKQTGTPL